MVAGSARSWPRSFRGGVLVDEKLQPDADGPAQQISASSAAVSARMQRQARADTAPEMAVRRLLHARGHRYRVGWPVPGSRRRTIDVAFVGRRVAVFIDGCFWHSCPIHATSPRANAGWWTSKLSRNRDRDRETDEFLRRAAWTVLRIWEHEEPESAVRRIEEVLERRPSPGVRRTGSAASLPPGRHRGL